MTALPRRHFKTHHFFFFFFKLRHFAQNCWTDTDVDVAHLPEDILKWNVVLSVWRQRRSRWQRIWPGRPQVPRSRRSGTPSSRKGTSTLRQVKLQIFEPDLHRKAMSEGDLNGLHGFGILIVPLLTSETILDCSTHHFLCLGLGKWMKETKTACQERSTQSVCFYFQ